jgi:Holliday junction resolvasome RuvABC endonuclease subunit
MRSVVRIMGVDPGFANLGLFGLVLDSKGNLTGEFAEVVQTKKSPKKINLRQYDDEIRRLTEIERAIQGRLDTFKPDLVASERFASLRSAQTTRQIALVFGALHALAWARDLPFLLFEPGDVKREVCGNRSASKIQVIRTLQKELAPFAGWPDGKKVEHVADAAGAAKCARHDRWVAMLLRERGAD